MSSPTVIIVILVVVGIPLAVCGWQSHLRRRVRKQELHMDTYPELRTVPLLSKDEPWSSEKSPLSPPPSAYVDDQVKSRGWGCVR